MNHDCWPETAWAHCAWIILGFNLHVMIKPFYTNVFQFILYLRMPFCKLTVTTPYKNWSKFLSHIRWFRYRVRHKKVFLFGVNFPEFYWLLKNQSICIGKRKDKLKFWGVFNLIGSKVMLQWIKKLLSESAQNVKYRLIKLNGSMVGCTISTSISLF